MKTTILVAIILVFFNVVNSSAQSVNYTWPGLSFGGNSPDAKRYLIGRLYYNAMHWGDYSVIRIKLKSKWYRAGYVEYLVMNGPNYANSYCISAHGPGTIYGRIVLGPQTSAGSSYSGGENYYKNIYFDAGSHATWFIEAEARGTHFSIDKNTITAGEYAAATLFSNPVLEPIATFNDTKRSMFTTGSAIAYFNDKVGIGTMDPQAALAVNGEILAKKVKVSTAPASWPDYVFKKEYRLPPLSEVETFINNNNHLPGVPSAQQIEADGHDLGEMNRILLQKMEEMTLYIIRQDKRMKTLEKKIQLLETGRNDSLPPANQ